MKVRKVRLMDLRPLNTLKNEEGFALILAIVIMAAMAAIGIAVVTTSTTDVLIARNEVEDKTAFYIAEAGLEDAIGRFSLSEGATRFVGETVAQRTSRMAGAVTYTGDGPLNSSDAMLEGSIGGDYVVNIEFATEAAESWCNPSGDCTGTPEIVLYCVGFGFAGSGIPSTCYEGTTPMGIPVYKIESVGTTDAGTQARVVAYITESALNVEPPAGDIYSMGGITVGGGGDIAGEVCGSSTGGCTDDCVDVCTGTTHTTVSAGLNMNTYLGIDIDDMRGYADEIHDQSGASTVTYNGEAWGDICSTTMDGSGNGTPNEDPEDIPDHICNNDSEIIYIDNQGAGDARVNVIEGRGILVVTGDLAITGTLTWEGMIYVMGSISGNGNVNVIGTIMSQDTIGFSGNMTAFGSLEVANGVTINLGVPKMLRWYRDQV